LAAPSRTRRNPRALLALLLITVIWGWTFVWMKQALLAGERVLGADAGWVTIGLFLTLRFGLAALILPLVKPAARHALDAPAWRGGLVLGGLLLAGFLLQMLGLRDVSAPVSAFLTSLYVLFTALLMALVHGRVPQTRVLAGALLATLGAAYISGPPQLSFGLAEGLTVASAFVFALHILATDHVTRAVPPLAVTLTSFVVVTAGAAVCLAVALRGAAAPGVGAVLALAQTSAFLWPMLGSSALATLVAISLMNVYQREVEPVRAAILYAIEPVWAALIAVAAGLGRLDLWTWIGGAALLAGNLVAEIGVQGAAAAPEGHPTRADP
jgi:drug/metabolite transporter (DMT)-like permease